LVDGLRYSRFGNYLASSYVEAQGIDKSRQGEADVTTKLDISGMSDLSDMIAWRLTREKERETTSGPPRVYSSEPPRVYSSKPPRVYSSEPPRVYSSEPPRVRSSYDMSSTRVGARVHSCPSRSPPTTYDHRPHKLTCELNVTRTLDPYP